MSGPQGSFAYAQARLQARLGVREASDLQRARTARDLPAYLQQLRGSSCARCISRVAPGMGLHEVERRLREEWLATVDQVARWQPADWQPALRWMRWLPYLPALQKIARGGRLPAWTREDPVLARVVAADRESRPTSLRATALQPLESAVAAHEDVTDAWVRHWRGLWPPQAAAQSAGLVEILRRVGEAAATLALLGTSATSEETHRSLAAVFIRAFRRHPLSPTTAVAYLGLEALDQLEVRGEIAARIALAAEAAA